MTSITIAAPDDWHVHLRDDHMLAAVAPFTANAFRYALVMPNLVPPITSTAMAEGYRARILAAAGPDARADFTPLMGLYLNDDLVIEDLMAGVAAGVVFAVKYYPAGATTNSEAGGASLIGYQGVLEAMAEAGIPLLVHAESTDPDIDIFDREAAFLDAELAPACDAVPGLTVTVEHLSTRAGIDFVAGRNGIGGSITPHHLTCDRSDVLANGLRPDLYCKPVINSRDERLALASAAISGNPSFFIGTDSAPHPLSHKETGRAKPGIFNAPYALEVIAELFYENNALGRLEAFLSLNGPAHYGLAPAESTVTLRREELAEAPPDTVTIGDGIDVRIFGAEAAGCWTVS
ncbi:MAG: dihydroorotase [Acidimicrobiaceae bacterium]|nr:dihydroorotase [Acidimicrobiaceae bacterium]